MEARCRTEVVELHRFFEDWFHATLDPTDDSFSRLAGVLAPDFVIVSPRGALIERQALLTGLREEHGSWSEGGRIRIENYRFHRQIGEIGVVTYEEWHDVGGETRGRLSTAVFRLRQGTPTGVEWLHVHEVWLQQGTPPA